MDYHYLVLTDFQSGAGTDGRQEQFNDDVLAAQLSLGASTPDSHHLTDASLLTRVSFPVHYGVIITSTVLVVILFVIVYVQLVMVICFGYKLLSYQTILLFNILLWAALRLTLYSFYYFNCCELVNKLSGKFSGWFLVSLPSVLQYFSLAVLVHYFGESIFKVLSRRQEMSSLVPPYRKMRKLRILGEFLFVTAVVTFLGGNVTFYFIIGDHEFSKHVMSIVVIFRVILLDGLFLVMGIILFVCVIIIYTTRAGRDVLEAQHGRRCIPFFFSCCLILLFATRIGYSIIAVVSGSSHSVHSGYSWMFATDEGDYEFLSKNGEANKYGYIAYFSILVIWEVMPTYIIVFFFRVRIPYYTYNNSLNACKCKVLRKKKTTAVNQKHFFENPNRYDETEQLLHASVQAHHSDMITTQVSIPSLTNSMNNVTPQNYGSNSSSTVKNISSGKHSINNNYHGSGCLPAVMPGTTPPQLFTSPSFFDR